MGNRYPAPSYEEDEDYFVWLCELVDAEDPDNGYDGLMRYLYNVEFSEKTAKLIPNDDNRIFDGIDLRREFEKESFYENYGCLEGPCSLLEMLIAMSYRIEDDFGIYDNIGWFWEMLRNLGISDMTDRNFYAPGGVDYVEEKVRRLLERRYSRDGSGSLFPLKNCSEDQRKLEIWYQMSFYIVENYME